METERQSAESVAQLRREGTQAGYLSLLSLLLFIVLHGVIHVQIRFVTPEALLVYFGFLPLIGWLGVRCVLRAPTRQKLLGWLSLALLTFIFVGLFRELLPAYRFILA